MSTYFDQPYYLAINEARWTAAERILNGLPPMKTCLDIGCGPGWFSERLARRGLVVLGVEGRKEIVEVARERVPGVLFSQVDVEERSSMAALPTVDLVFCFGLLYHLENPMRVIRSIAALGTWTLIETQIALHSGPVFQLVEEGQNETQGLGYHAAIPSRAALVHALYKSGAGCVERYQGVVNHADFVDTDSNVHRREIFLVSPSPSGLPDFIREDLPAAPKIDTSRLAQARPSK